MDFGLGEAAKVLASMELDRDAMMRMLVVFGVALFIWGTVLGIVFVIVLRNAVKEELAKALAAMRKDALAEFEAVARDAHERLVSEIGEAYGITLADFREAYESKLLRANGEAGL